MQRALSSRSLSAPSRNAQPVRWNRRNEARWKPVCRRERRWIESVVSSSLVRQVGQVGLFDADLDHALGSLTARLFLCCPAIGILPFILLVPSVEFQRRGSLQVVAMKKDIHPKYNEEAKVFCNGEEVLTVSGCKPEYVVDVWSGNHPFYTGALTTSVGEESRIAQFQKRYGGLYGDVAPVSAGGNTKLTYKKPDGKKKKK